MMVPSVGPKCRDTMRKSVVKRRCVLLILPLLLVLCGLSLYDSNIDQMPQKPCHGEVNYAGLPKLPQEITLRNDLWQVEKGNDSETAIFRAYYDDREPVRSVRVIAISSKHGIPPLCMYWAGQEPLTSFLLPATEIEKGRGAVYNNAKYMEKIYNCPFPVAKRFPASHVSLVHSANTTRLSNVVPIIFPSRQQVHGLGACIPLTYGTVDPGRLIEWLELNKLLGVGEFNFYTSRLNREAMAVLHHYEQQGTVKVVNMSPPFQFDSANASWCYWCQKVTVLAALNDCMYSNMYRYNYLLTLDVDEMIVPKNETVFTLVQLLQSLDPTGKYSEYEFRNTYFFLDLNATTVGRYERHLRENNFTSAETQAGQNVSGRHHEKLYQTFLKVRVFPHSVTTSYLCHIAPSPLHYAPKSIINPRKCVLLQNHRCFESVPKTHNVLNVDVTQAASNHYKKCHFTQEECQAMMKEVFLDDGVLKYGQSLVFNVLTQYKQLEDQIAA